MSYRKITVRGISYKYVVGKSVIKIVPPEGKSIVIQKTELAHLNYVCSPAIIRDLILENDISDPSKYFNHCNHSDRKARFDPFESEIREKYVTLYICDDCYHEIGMNI